MKEAYARGRDDYDHNQAVYSQADCLVFYPAQLTKRTALGDQRVIFGDARGSAACGPDSGSILDYGIPFPDTEESVWYTVTSDGGDFWSALYVGEESVGDDLYFGQSGDPHFVRSWAD